jgi:hypothetical protein
MYYIVEVLSSTRTKQVSYKEHLDIARIEAYNHSVRSGLTVEIQDERGRMIEDVIAWRE